MTIPPALPVGTGGWASLLEPRVQDGNLQWFDPTTRWVEGAPGVAFKHFSVVAERMRPPSDESVRKLAYRWGPLFHGLGGRHHNSYVEPVAAWRRLLQDLKGCRRLVVLHREGEYVTMADWALFGNVVVLGELGAPKSAVRIMDTVEAFMPTSLEALRDGPWVDPLDRSTVEPHPDTELVAAPPIVFLGRYIDLLMKDAAAQFAWSERMQRVEVVPKSLLSALGLGLAESVRAKAGLATCAGCGRTFERSRIKPGETAWCDQPKCKNASRAAASARYRERQRKQGER